MPAHISPFFVSSRRAARSLPTRRPRTWPCPHREPGRSTPPGAHIGCRIPERAKSHHEWSSVRSLPGSSSPLFHRISDEFVFATRKTVRRIMREIPHPCEVHAMATTPASQAPVEDLNYPAGSLVLLAGLPGAGKSTLLDQLCRITRRRARAGAHRRGVGDRLTPVPQLVGALSRPDPPAGPHPDRARHPCVGGSPARCSAGHSVVAHTRGTWPHILYRLRLAGPPGRQRGPPDHARRGAADRRARGSGPPRPGRHRRHLHRHCRRWRVLIGRARGGALPRPPGSSFWTGPRRTCSGPSDSASGGAGSGRAIDQTAAPSHPRRPPVRAGATPGVGPAQSRPTGSAAPAPTTGVTAGSAPAVPPAGITTAP